MSDGAEHLNTLNKTEHIDENVSAKRVGLYGWDGSNWQRISSSFGKLVPDSYDYIELGYDADDRLDTVTYKDGGSGGTTVATLTITYDGTSKRIETVTRS